MPCDASSLPSLLSLLRDRAARAPGRTAYAWPGGEMTQGELAALALSAGTCTARRVPPRSGVALLMDGHGADCVPAMLGVLAADCFYAPLDPDSPAPRLRLLLEGFDPALILADEKGLRALAGLETKAPCLSFDTVRRAPADPALLSSREAGSLPEDLAMVLYTSGSTGLPKGTAHSRLSLARWAPATARLYGITEDTVLAAQSPWFYANSLLELFVPLGTGARVELVPPACLAFPKLFPPFLRDRGITELCMTPSGFSAVASAGVLEEGALPALALMILSGEAAPAKPLLAWRAAAPRARVMHFYGSTEALSVAVGPLSPDPADGPLPVGPAFPGVRLLLLREDGTEAAPGETGEILVQSPWIARGYYRDPARTGALLGPDPTGARTGTFLRTGDLGRLSPEGQLTVLGRKDSMVKHRGYRMETGEVEYAARSAPGCLEARCLMDPDSGELYCFAAGELTEKALRAHLRARLPGYMLPERIRILDSLPRGAGGKTDLARLRALMSPPKKEPAPQDP